MQLHVSTWYSHKNSSIRAILITRFYFHKFTSILFTVVQVYRVCDRFDVFSPFEGIFIKVRYIDKTIPCVKLSEAL